MKMLKKNTSVKFHYEVLSEYICGIVLNGYEVKPIKKGNFSYIDSYASIENNEIILKKLHVNLRENSINTTSLNDSIETCDRKLLLKKYEIAQIKRAVIEKGLTIVPLEIFIDGSLIKVKIAVCKGKKIYEKKQILKERDIKRELDREIKHYN